ncbi:baseplate J/gp47 family protein [Pseudomonas sp. YuFO8]|uniref:baseplate J/gp47 family protein n=1 Tax=Pseudomonas sp. YuFO8 TaxID=3095361 RepID=UPI002B25034B|nr:baseplate J/gp47 family protein [Pseudomonas sp. YuFO8]MEB2621405.1 baseplate J/gp47 family protein [Pseudomonas sp. YuFO8]
MPYEIPTLPALTQRTEADFERNAPDALRRADAKVAARALSGTAFELYGYQDWISRQSNPATCDEEMLLRWAEWRLEGGRTPAVAAKGLASVTGSSGALVDVDQAYRSDDGRRYVVAQAVKLVNGAATLQLVAEEVGSLGNIEAGNLTAVTPVLGVNPTASIGADGIVGGAELEGLEALRGRVQAAFKNPSKVGNGADFVEWALEVPGVTRAWALPRWMGPGTFGLAFVRDGDPDIIPTPAQVAEVQAHLEQRRPVTAEVYAVAPVARAIHFSLRLVPDGLALREAVKQALRGLIVDEGGPGQTLKISRLRAAISNTPGEADHVLSVPAADVSMAANEVAVPGVMTWL